MLAKSAGVTTLCCMLCATAVAQQFYDVEPATVTPIVVPQAPSPLPMPPWEYLPADAPIPRSPFDTLGANSHSPATLLATDPADQHDDGMANAANVGAAVVDSSPNELATTTSLVAPTNNNACCPPRIWASAEYVLWWVVGTDVPALVTTSDDGTPRPIAARLNQPTTTTLWGGQDLNASARSGVRFTLGSWLDMCNSTGIELNFLILGNDETRFQAPDQATILGRPFFHLPNNEQDAKLIRFPTIVQGDIQSEIKSEFLTGAALLRKRSGWGNRQLDWYIGYRHASLMDDLRIDEVSTIVSGPTAGTIVSLFDQFRTRNRFHGVDLGVRVGTRLLPHWEVECKGTVALGTLRAETEILGGTATTFAGTTANADVGFLVQPTNAGVVKDDDFSTISELTIASRCQFRPGLHLIVGYSLLVWNDVARVGESIDTTINTSQLPPGVLLGEPRPALTNVKTDFWAHGIRVGFEYLF